jgi:hypothetical protein
MMANQKPELGLFDVLEAELRKSKEPLDCATLFERPSVREHAATVNRVSDYLGNLWRKGLVLRLPAPRLEGTKARWLYMWKDKGPKKKAPVDLSQAIAYDENVDRLLGKPSIEVSEDGKTISITTPYCTITVQQTDHE